MTDIQFIIINDREQHALDNVGELVRRVSFPVYQDTVRNNIWRSLRGRKDDLLIYDRCGYLTYHIPYPRSLLNRHEFQNGLWNTYFSNPCNCESVHSSYVQSETQQAQVPDRGQSQHGHGQQQHQHQHHHHHHGHSRHRVRRHQRHPGHNSPQPSSGITLHRDRWSEIFSNRISKCRFDDTLCHILYSNGIRFRKRHERFVNRLLSQH